MPAFQVKVHVEHYWTRFCVRRFGIAWRGKRLEHGAWAGVHLAAIDASQAEELAKAAVIDHMQRTQPMLNGPHDAAVSASIEEPPKIIDLAESASLPRVQCAWYCETEGRKLKYFVRR